MYSEVLLKTAKTDLMAVNLNEPDVQHQQWCRVYYFPILLCYCNASVVSKWCKYDEIRWSQGLHSPHGYTAVFCMHNGIQTLKIDHWSVRYTEL